LNRYPDANKHIEYVSLILSKDSIVEFPILKNEEVEFYVVCGLHIYFKYSVAAQRYNTVPINHLKYIKNLEDVVPACVVSVLHTYGIANFYSLV